MAYRGRPFSSIPPNRRTWLILPSSTSIELESSILSQIVGLPWRPTNRSSKTTPHSTSGGPGPNRPLDCSECCTVDVAVDEEGEVQFVMSDQIQRRLEEVMSLLPCPV